MLNEKKIQMARILLIKDEIIIWYSKKLWKLRIKINQKNVYYIRFYCG